MKAFRAVMVTLALSSLLSGCPCKWWCSTDKDRFTGVPDYTLGNYVVATFSGHVVSDFNEAVPWATVEVNGLTTVTDGKGDFRLSVPAAAKYAVSIRKQGLGALWKVYRGEVQGKRWTLTKATVVLADPTQRITAKDTPACKARAPRSLQSTAPCSPGIEVVIPANSLVDTSGTAPADKVQVTVSTIDIYTPDAMPGDDTVLIPPGLTGAGIVSFPPARVGTTAAAMQPREASGPRTSVPTQPAEGKDTTPPFQLGFMGTFGAGFVTVTTVDGRPLQPRKAPTHDQLPIITIPIDPATRKQLAARHQQPPQTIPFLYFDEKQGAWIKEGDARLNATQDAYEAKLSHFSAFNMDIIFTGSACIEIDSRKVDGIYDLEVSSPWGNSSGIPGYKTKPPQRFSDNYSSVTGTGVGYHVAYALPPASDLTAPDDKVRFRVFKDLDGDGTFTDFIGRFERSPGGIRAGASNPPPATTQTSDSHMGYYPDDCKERVIFVEAKQAEVPTLNPPTSPQPGQATLSWSYTPDSAIPLDTDNTDGMVDRYVVEFSTDSGFPQASTTTMPMNGFSTTTTSSPISGLTEGATYYFRIHARYGSQYDSNRPADSGTTNPSNTGSVTVRCAATNTACAGIPEIMSVSYPSPGSIRLRVRYTWKAANPQHANDAYLVKESSDGTAGSFSAPPVSVHPTSGIVTVSVPRTADTVDTKDVDLTYATPCTAHYFQVQARYGTLATNPETNPSTTNLGPWTPQKAAGNTPAPGLVIDIDDPVASPGTVSVDIKPTAPWDSCIPFNAADAIEIEEASDAGFTTNKVTFPLVDSSNRTLALSTLSSRINAPGALKWYRVRAYYGDTAQTAAPYGPYAAIQPRTLQIVNAIPYVDGRDDQDIVRLRFSLATALPASEPELLTGTSGSPSSPCDDGGWNSKIPRRQSGIDGTSPVLGLRRLDNTPFSSYHIYIGMGWFFDNNGTCERKETYDAGGTQTPEYRYFYSPITHNTGVAKTLTVDNTGGPYALKDGASILLNAPVSSPIDPLQ